jgi:phytanoyl-CoA hydroxylase
MFLSFTAMFKDYQECYGYSMKNTSVLTDAKPSGYFQIDDLFKIQPFFAENGYCVVENLFTQTEIEELRAEILSLCKNIYQEIDGIEKASENETSEEILRRVLCIHFPNKASTLMRKNLSHSAIVQVLQEVIGENVKCMQSMLFIKASGKPGQAWHQDEDYIPTRDRSLTGAWIALDDATIENGCLWVIPKSHKAGILWPQKKQVDQRFDCSHESFNFPWNDDQSVPVEVKAGSVVFFNGYLLHRSLLNKAKSGFRRALVHHYMSAESLLPWSKPTTESMALADYRDIVLVCGKDPYAYKGLTNISKSFVRKSREGGCEDWAKD